MSAGPALAARRGFTLVEVLAGLALSLTAVALLTVAVGVVSGAWGRGGASAERGDSIGRAGSRFTDDVESMVPWRYAVGDRGAIVFDGEKGAVVFAAVAATGSYGAPRLRFVSYRFIAGAHGFDIERRVALLGNSPQKLDPDWTETITVLAGVDAPELAFADPTATGTVWRDAWPAGPTLPAAIRLSFSLAGRPVVVEAPVYADPQRDCLLPVSRLGCDAPNAPAAPAQPAAPAPPPATGQDL